MNWMDKLRRTDDCVTIGSYKIRRLLFAYDFVLLAFSESSFRYALKWFAAACDIVRMKNQHLQNSGYTSFKKFCQMFSASWRDIIEAGEDIQVSCGRIHE